MKPGMRRLLAGAALVLFGVGIGWIVAIRPGGRAADTPPMAETTQLWTCGMHPQVLQDHPGSCPICHMALTPVRTAGGPAAGSDIPANAVLIDPVIVQNMGLRLAPVTLGAVETRVSAVGTLRMDETRAQVVTLKVDGWIDRLHAATIGQPIRRGDVLFDFYSPELAVAVEEYRGAIVARDARDAPGAAAIGSHGMEAIAAAARARLLQWDVAPGDLNKALLRYSPRLTMPVRSAVTGTLLEKNVTAGDAVMAGAVLFRIADLSTLWLDASLYESQAAGVKTGDVVRAVISGDSGPSLTGKVIFISPLVDPMTRVTTVRMEFPNPDLRYRPGMFARVEFVAPVGPDGLTVPREAIIDTGRRQIVFVTRGGGRFEPREVQMGRVTDDGQAEVLSGLAVGDTVVVSGQFLLDAESRTQEAIQKMLDHRGHGSGAGR